MKRLLVALSAALSAMAGLALEVKDVAVLQRRPWSNLVDVAFTLSGVEDGAETKVSLKATYPGCPQGGLPAASLASDPVVRGNGRHRLVWDLGKDAPGLVTKTFTVTAEATPFAPTDALYMVIDLSSGPESENYPTRYSFTAPDLADDTCRTTELWLKRVPAGTFSMGKKGTTTGGGDYLPAHDVTLTKPFYMAIFPVTQKQWERVKGNWPSYFTNETYRAVRPVETVSWSDVRGHGGWYDSSALGASTFTGLLRAKSGQTGLDLPSEAQWEYVCRAGTTGDWYFPEGSGYEAEYARTKGWNDEFYTTDRNQNLSKGTAKVGSYKANPWGFYDFYGNVSEYVPDGSFHTEWSAHGVADLDVTTDPRWALKEDKNQTWAGICRGSGWTLGPWCVNSYRRFWQQYAQAGGASSIGFRVCVTVK